MYTVNGNRHQITIDGKTFWVDSNQEEALIRWLEANGFHDKWRRTDYGLKSNAARYTPDLEVSVLLPNGKTDRAIVESKPTLKHFDSGAKERMRKVAKYYGSSTLLLYTHDTQIWRTIDTKTGVVSECATPLPGAISIGKLYQPATKRAKGTVWGKRYRERLEIGKSITMLLMNGLESGMRVLFAPSQKNKGRRKRKK